MPKRIQIRKTYSNAGLSALEAAFAAVELAIALLEDVPE